MALTQTHEQLELWVSILTIAGPVVGIIGGFAIRGWKKAVELEREAINDKLKDQSKMIETQWNRIDDLRSKSETFITRDRHDQSIRDIYDAIEKAVEVATKPLIDALNRLADKVDKLMDKK